MQQHRKPTHPRLRTALSAAKRHLMRVKKMSYPQAAIEVARYANASVASLARFEQAILRFSPAKRMEFEERQLELLESELAGIRAKTEKSISDIILIGDLEAKQHIFEKILAKDKAKFKR